MFVCVARLTLDVPAAASLKARRQVVRRVTDRVKARFNVAVSEVDDDDTFSRAILALAVVGNSHGQVNEQMDKIIHSIEESYLAPVASRETETLGFGAEIFSGAQEGRPDALMGLTIPTGERSLAEAEGLGEWDERPEGLTPAPVAAAKKPKVKTVELSLEDVRKKALSLRNRRDWEK